MVSELLRQVMSYLLTECLATQSTWETIILVMGSLVGLHVSLLREAFPTDITMKRLDLGMDTSLVGPEVSSLSEAFATMSTGKVLLSSMYLHMSVHITFLSETFPTDLSVKKKKKCRK